MRITKLTVNESSIAVITFSVSSYHNIYKLSRSIASEDPPIRFLEKIAEWCSLSTRPFGATASESRRHPLLSISKVSQIMAIGLAEHFLSPPHLPPHSSYNS
jgi:hypothetical protein